MHWYASVRSAAVPPPIPFAASRFSVPSWADGLPPCRCSCLYFPLCRYVFPNEFGNINETHTNWPTKGILATEATNGGPNPGSVPSAEAYGHDIIGHETHASRCFASCVSRAPLLCSGSELSLASVVLWIGDLNNWVQGWTDWNIVLDTQGGPNHLQNWSVQPRLTSPRAPSTPTPHILLADTCCCCVVRDFAQVRCTRDRRCGCRNGVDSTHVLVSDTLLLSSALDFSAALSRRSAATTAAFRRVSCLSVFVFVCVCAGIWAISLVSCLRVPSALRTR